MGEPLPPAEFAAAMSELRDRIGMPRPEWDVSTPT